MLHSIKITDNVDNSCHKISSIITSSLLKVSCVVTLSAIVSIVSSVFFNSQMNTFQNSYGFSTALGTGVLVGSASCLNLNEGIAFLPIAGSLGMLSQFVKSNMIAFLASSAIFGYVIGKNRYIKKPISLSNFFGTVSKKTVIGTIAATAIISSAGAGIGTGIALASVTTVGAIGGSLLVKCTNGLSRVEKLAEKIAHSSFVNSILGKIGGFFHPKNKKNIE
jgi:hypothetical protein